MKNAGQHGHSLLRLQHSPWLPSWLRNSDGRPRRRCRQQVRTCARYEVTKRSKITNWVSCWNNDNCCVYRGKRQTYRLPVFAYPVSWWLVSQPGPWWWRGPSLRWAGLSFLCPFSSRCYCPVANRLGSIRSNTLTNAICDSGIVHVIPIAEEQIADKQARRHTDLIRFRRGLIMRSPFTNFLFIEECHRFLMALSVLPGRLLAISAHLDIDSQGE